MSDDPRRGEGQNSGPLQDPPPSLFWAEVLVVLEEISVALDLLAEAAQEQAESLRQLAEKEQG
jgi:hypothetical protein